MLNKYPVTVISGVYDPPEALFKKFLDSCLNTTLTPCEFIIISDNPNNKTITNVLQQYELLIKSSQHNFIIIENEKNLGTNNTYNVGLEKATGEYVAFFDSDDFFDNDFLEVMYNYCKNNNEDILTGYSITHFYGEIDPMPFVLMESTNGDIWVNMFRRSLLIDNNIKYIDDTIMIENAKIVPNIKIDKLPLECCVFYHYVRNQNSVSKYSIDETLENLQNELNTIKKEINIIQKGINNTTNKYNRLLNVMPKNISPIITDNIILDNNKGE